MALLESVDRTTFQHQKAYISDGPTKRGTKKPKKQIPHGNDHHGAERARRPNSQNHATELKRRFYRKGG
jgi:hypothetical protein